MEMTEAVVSVVFAVFGSLFSGPLVHILTMNENRLRGIFLC